MESKQLNKRKIFNDPVYGFISVTDELIFDIIEHPFFQRLRRIKQLGLSHMVFPGALHTRFHHAMGAMFLMGDVIDVLRSKNHEIDEREAQAAKIAILLHDIGHGPYSHALENSLVYKLSHEKLSGIFMDRLNEEFKGQLKLAIEIFRNKYKKKFLHQLVSGQLDVDRLDYLKRDSFFTGVSEGIISAERIIKMMNVARGKLVVEVKGIYSIEKFIIARRLMYWQVYLHKTVLAAEFLLVKILQRARYLADKKAELFCTPTLKEFLYHKYSQTDFERNHSLLNTFSNLDDFDIFTSVKVWSDHPDFILSTLCKNLVNRHLFHTELQKKAFSEKQIKEIRKKVMTAYKCNEGDAIYFAFSGKVENDAYNLNNAKINILLKDGGILDISEASDQLNVSALTKTVTKYFLCYPKNI